jgi:hypothetical protein
VPGKRSRRRKAAKQAGTGKYGSKREPFNSGSNPPIKNESALLCCSICGLNQNQVRKLIVSPSANICYRCILSINGILEERRHLLPVSRDYREKCSFCEGFWDTPQALVIGHDIAICVDCLEFCNKILSEESIESEIAYGSDATII